MRSAPAISPATVVRTRCSSMGGAPRNTADKESRKPRNAVNEATHRVRSVLLAGVMLLAFNGGMRGQELPVVGFYAIDDDVVWTGDQAVLSMTLLLTNDGELPVGVLVSLASVDTPLDGGPELETEWTIGSFAPAEIAAGASARLSAKFVVPGDEYRRWTEREGPPLWLTYVGDGAWPVGYRLLLSKTGSIGDPADQF
jgi:hypothetical protein